MAGDANTPGLSRANILRSVEASLARLQTGYLDLLYTHVWDDATPLQETLETLGWLVQQGKVVFPYFPISLFPYFLISLRSTV